MLEKRDWVDTMEIGGEEKQEMTIEEGDGLIYAKKNACCLLSFPSIQNRMPSWVRHDGWQGVMAWYGLVWYGI